METFLRFTVTGIAVASVYAIAASGLVVTYTTSGIFNFAHGAFGMMAAFTYWQFNVGWGWGPLASFLMVVFVVAPIFGGVIERVIMRGLQGTSEVVKIVVTVSLLLALIGVANLLWPPDIGRNNQNFFPNQVVRIFGVNVSYHRLLIFGVAALVAIVLRFILYRTRLGITMRAVVDDRPLVQLNGGRPDRSAMLSWAIGASLAAVSGVLISSEFGLSQIPLSLLVVNAYAAAVVGRLRSLPMTFVGALILGLTEAYVAGYLTAGKQIWGLELGNLQYAISPILLFVFMVAQPQERLRASGVHRIREGWAMPTMQTAVFGAIGLVVATWAISDLMPADTALIPLLPGFFFALVALSLVPLTGYAGQISLAQMTFAGIGGVLMAVVGPDRTPLGLLVAVVVTALVGALVALPALRLTGIYLALATAAFSLFMTKVVFNQAKIMPGGNRQVPALDFGIFEVRSNQGQLMVLTATFALIGVGLIALRRSSFGRRLSAMKDSPVACATLGLDLTRTKVAVFALSAAIAGLAGALWSRSIQTITFELTTSMSVTTLAVVGGVGAVAGAFIGGMLLGTLQSIAAAIFANNAIGYFKFAEISIPALTQITPGLMGISLGKNPNGAISDISSAYRGVGKSKPALAISLVVPTILWGLARNGTIVNWTFTASLSIFVLSVVPLTPILVTKGEGRRHIPTALFLAAVMIAVTLLNWETAIGSHGMKFVLIFAIAAATARVGLLLLGASVPGTIERVPVPSPDLLGVGTPITKSDLVEADAALGLTKADVRGAA